MQLFPQCLGATWRVGDHPTEILPRHRALFVEPVRTGRPGGPPVNLFRTPVETTGEARLSPPPARRHQFVAFCHPTPLRVECSGPVACWVQRRHYLGERRIDRLISIRTHGHASCPLGAQYGSTRMASRAISGLGAGLSPGPQLRTAEIARLDPYPKVYRERVGICTSGMWFGARQEAQLSSSATESVIERSSNE
jgi:hypothetical protein